MSSGCCTRYVETDPFNHISVAGHNELSSMRPIIAEHPLLAMTREHAHFTTSYPNALIDGSEFCLHDRYLLIIPRPISAHGTHAPHGCVLGQAPNDCFCGFRFPKAKFPKIYPTFSAQ